MDDNRTNQAYSSDIDKFNLLTEEREIELAHLVAKGDKLAWEEFINSNLRLVRKIARKYSKGDKVLEQDLIQQGNEGMIKIVRRFDTDREVKFSTYATWWIRQAITRYLNKSSFITLPVHRKQDVNRMIKIAREYKIEDDGMYRHGSAVIFMDEFNKRYPKKNGKKYTAYDIKVMLENYHRSVLVSMSLPFLDDSNETLADNIEDTNAVDPSVAAGEISTREEIKDFLCKLSERQRLVVVKRFDIDGKGEHTFEQIGKMIGVTRERVRQILVDALGRLKNIMAHLEGEV